MPVSIRLALPLAAILALSGCQSASEPAMASPVETMLNQAANAELGAQICQSDGGLRATRRLTDAADATYAKARQMGATDADIAAARLHARQQAEGDQKLYGNAGTCNRLMQFPDGYTPES